MKHVYPIYTVLRSIQYRLRSRPRHVYVAYVYSILQYHPPHLYRLQVAASVWQLLLLGSDAQSGESWRVLATARSTKAAPPAIAQGAIGTSDEQVHRPERAAERAAAVPLLDANFLVVVVHPHRRAAAVRAQGRFAWVMHVSVTTYTWSGCIWVARRLSPEFIAIASEV